MFIDNKITETIMSKLRTIGVEIECVVPEYRSYKVEREIEELGADTVGDGSITCSGDDQQGIEIRTQPLSGQDFANHIEDVTAVLHEHEALANKSCGLHVHVDASEISPIKILKLYNESIWGALISVSDYIGGKLYTETAVEDCTALYIPVTFIKKVQKTRFDAKYLTYSELYTRVEQYINAKGVITVKGSQGEGITFRGMTSFKPWEDRGTVPASWLVLYVNIDALRNNHTVLKNSMDYLASIDSTIRALLPVTRRKNSYCLPISKVVATGGHTTTTNTMELLRQSNTRYCGFNYQSINRHGTIECRYHGGTVDTDKIKHWGMFIERVINSALSKNATTLTGEFRDIVHEKQKLLLLLSALGLPEATEKYILERFKRFHNSDSKRVATLATNLKAVTPAYN